MTTEVAVANLSGHVCYVESSDGTHMIGLGPGQITRLHIWKGKTLKVCEDETPEVQQGQTTGY